MKKTLAKILALALCAVLLVTGTVFITLAYLQAQTGVIKNTFTTAGINLKLDEATVDQDGNALIYYSDGAPVEYLDTDDTEGLTSEKTANVTEATRWNATANTNSNGDLTVLGNKYFLVPNKTYVKDPTVHVGKSAPCYVVIAVRNTIFTEATELDDVYVGIENQILANGWMPLDYNLNTNDGAPLSGLGWNNTENNKDYTLYYYAGDHSDDGIVDTSSYTDSDPALDLPIFATFTIPDLDELKSFNGETLEVIAIAVQSATFELNLDDDNMNSVEECINQAFKSAGFFGKSGKGDEV